MTVSALSLMTTVMLNGTEKITSLATASMSSENEVEVPIKRITQCGGRDHYTNIIVWGYCTKCRRV
jgi:hypothetical protein